MNGEGTLEDSTLINRRPIITCSGELEVFSVIEDALSQALPQDTGEWRRSLGRSMRLVHIGVSFAPFDAIALPTNNQWDLIRQPLFHIYWTECGDVDLYKATIRDEIELWLKELTSRDISDWLIVVVENYDGKRANKLLSRTTVLDKIRADFAPKQGDRCISVINPGKVETRSADSWRGLVSRVRHLVLIGYARAVARLEDHVRQQRERRNEAGWNFMQYFKLQEELAQVLEMLGLYDEALVQYDELDALFSQFVVNGQTGDAISWLADFQKPLERWHALKLGPSVLHAEPSLLELRAYLYAKQAHMLILTNKIWEVSSRCLPFLHTCTKELLLLEISSPAGALSCWQFLASMEVLHACNKHNQADQIEAYLLHTACLWAYASQKLRELGDLCGLMPGACPNSNQLHLVVNLSAGMGDNPGLDANTPSPTDKLKQALCSQTAFNKTYLELAELAMGTYKHIGRLRSARLIGKQVASFYMLLGEIQKSAAFLNDALKTFEEDNWRELAAQTQIELADCYRKSGDFRKFIRACAAVASAPEIDNLIRWSFFDDMRKNLNKLEKVLIVPFKDIIKIINVQLRNEGVIMQDTDIEVDLIVDSNFPREICVDKVLISLEIDNKDPKKSGRRSSNLPATIIKPDISLQRLRIQRHLDYQQDKQLASASVVCRNQPLKRANSNVAPMYHSDFQEALQNTQTTLVLKPGLNAIRLSKRALTVGKFHLGQVAIHVQQMELVSLTLVPPRLVVEVRREEPSVRLDKSVEALLSGVEQIMTLTVTVGSYAINPNTTIKLASSSGLTIQSNATGALVTNLDIPIEQITPFSSISVPIRVLAELPSKDGISFSHQVTISNCPWTNKPIHVQLSFEPPLTTSWRLHTVKYRKFVQIIINGQCDKLVSIADANLVVADATRVKSYNADTSQVISNGLSISYTYELLITPSNETPPLKCAFTLKYTINKNIGFEIREHLYNFEVTDYQTLFHVDARVEPTKGSEFCRVGGLCHLHLAIVPAGHVMQSKASLMYEVLAEQSLWAVCGRTAGVVSFETDFEAQTVVLDVMPLNSGFLPLPLVRLSKYIPADFGIAEKSNKNDQHPRLEPFCPGQVFNSSKGQQVHVINATTSDGHNSIT